MITTDTAIEIAGLNRELSEIKRYTEFVNRYEAVLSISEKCGNRNETMSYDINLTLLEKILNYIAKEHKAKLDELNYLAVQEAQSTEVKQGTPLTKEELGSLSEEFNRLAAEKTRLSGVNNMEVI